MRLSVETDRSAILQAIRMSDYPYKAWTLDPSLFERCVCLRVEHRGKPRGYIWAHWYEPGCLSVHAVALPERTIDWLGLKDRLLETALSVGADEVAVSFEGHPRRPGMERLVRSMGFFRDRTNPYLFRRLTRGRIAGP